MTDKKRVYLIPFLLFSLLNSDVLIFRSLLGLCGTGSGKWLFDSNRGERELCQRGSSEVNGPVSMLTVKSWLEPSGASAALSSSAVLKIIFKGKTEK